MTGAIRVQRLRLAAFRSYALAEIAPEGRSVAVWGPNGAGKTNLVEAVSMLAPGRGLRRAPGAELARRPGALWRVSGEIETPGGRIEVRTGVDDADAPVRRVEIDGKPETQAALGRPVRMVWLTPALDRLWLEAPAERRAFLDRVTLGLSPEHGGHALVYERAMRERTRLLRDEARPDPAWLGALEAQMAAAGARIAAARAGALTLLVAAQEGPEAGAPALFPRADLAILGPMEIRYAEETGAGRDPAAVEAALSAEFARALGAGRGRDQAAGRALAGPHRSDLDATYRAKAMPARACSTGEQKALLLSLVLAQARAIRDLTGAAPIVILDEVAAHLDAERRRALFGQIERLGAQAWMTATGPELFEGLGPALRIRVADGPGGSTLADA